jgi:hypothetical protein
MSQRPRPIGRVLVTLLFVVLAANALAQVALYLVGRTSDPPLLAAWQGASGVVALATAWASWTIRGWASHAAIGYGVVTAAMILALQPLLGLDVAVRQALLMGALTVLMSAMAAGWYLWRSHRQLRAEQP